MRLTGGGSVTNATGGQISGSATYGAIYIRHDGTVSNAAGATITGPVQVYDSAGLVINDGANNAQSSSAHKVQLSAGGTVTNAAGGTIAGSAIGVYLSDGTLSSA